MPRVEDAIVVAISGGLGNQMFQYAMGRSLALREGVPLFLDTRAAEADPQRAYAMGGFRLMAELIAPAERKALPWRLHPRLRWLPRWPGKMPYVAERGFAFDPAVLHAKAPAYLEGHWQSEKYFADVADTIRGDFQLREPLRPHRQEVADLIGNGTAVSVHVRRGDYVSNAAANAFHGTCEPEWYIRAIEQLEIDVDRPTFFVFSDDPDWARANLPIRQQAHFITPSTDGRDYEDMHLMALCRHHIIANSSFSWWGAWLNPHADKRVIAPARWFRRAIDTSDLIPAGWSRL